MTCVHQTVGNAGIMTVEVCVMSLHQIMKGQRTKGSECHHRHLNMFTLRTQTLILIPELIIDDGLTEIILCHAIHNYTGHNIMYDSVESLWSFN